MQRALRSMTARSVSGLIRNPSEATTWGWVGKKRTLSWVSGEQTDEDSAYYCPARRHSLPCRRRAARPLCRATVTLKVPTWPPCYYYDS